MKRQIIQIDEDRCTGCGECIPGCHEGALQMIDGKARLVSELMCDGLGACLGHCPEGAITLVEREAQPYDEVAVMREMVKKGKNTVIAHLRHLKDHNETGYMKQGMSYLLGHKEDLDFDPAGVRAAIHGQEQGERFGQQLVDHPHTRHHEHAGGCPGSRSMAFAQAGTTENQAGIPAASGLTNWPVQMHLINPLSPHFRNADLLLTADCVAYALGNFHQDYLRGKKLAIACPKLDNNREVYLEKLVTLIEGASVNTITVMKMEVPCCSGLLQLAETAVAHAGRKVPVKSVTIGIQGEIHEASWI